MNRFAMAIVSFLLAFAGMAYPQVPNAGFEQWSVGFPGEWAVNNVPGLVTPVTASSVSHSGQWALRGEVVELAGASLPPFVSSASADGFAVAQRHAALEGYYQFAPQGPDLLYALVYMYREGLAIGAGLAFLPATGGGYQRFSVPIDYALPGDPDHCYIQFQAGLDTTAATGGTLGTWFLLDDLSLSPVTGIEPMNEGVVPAQLTLAPNFPNPFNPVTTVQFGVPAPSRVTMVIYYVLGRTVVEVLREEPLPAGWHEFTWDGRDDAGRPVASGAYLYRLQSGGQARTGKMILNR